MCGIMSLSNGNQKNNSVGDDVGDPQQPSPELNSGTGSPKTPEKSVTIRYV